MGKYYTIDELSEIFDVSSRTIQRNILRLLDELSEKGKSLKIPENIALEIAERNGFELPKEINGQLVQAEYFTENEIIEFHKRLSEYPYLKEKITLLLNDLDYHRKSAESHNNQMEIILRSLEQRNYIEAKDKNIE